MIAPAIGITTYQYAREYPNTGERSDGHGLGERAGRGETQ
jgi:hypothetical protein